MEKSEEEAVPRRVYRSARRREQAEETRERVLAAASRLFAERGFGGATITAIADAADVAPETVYATFGNKRALLGELVRRAVRGRDEAPVPEQAGPAAIAAITDRREQLRLFASDIVVRLERVGPLLEVLTTAARTDAELAQLLARIHAERRANLATFVAALAANGALRLEQEEALDTVWALASPELHRLVTGVRGWTRKRYCDWLAGTLAALLL